MMLGTGETIVRLNRQREIKAIETGLASDPMVDIVFAVEVFQAGYAADCHDLRFNQKEGTTPWKRATEPELAVTPVNVDGVRTSLEATVALGGISGLRATFTGRKRAARQILRIIS
jgi:hypothetical protein